VGVALPPVLWAAHFIATYGLLSAACGPRDLLGLDGARLGIIAAGLAFILLIVLAGWRTGGARSGPMLAVGTFWSALVSAIAVLVQSIPAAIFATCN
jgi:hypothetical protein